MTDDFKPQGPDFDLNKFKGDTSKYAVKKFYCPYCSEKVVFHLKNKTDEDSFPCPSCQCVMVLE